MICDVFVLCFVKDKPRVLRRKCRPLSSLAESLNSILTGGAMSQLEAYESRGVAGSASVSAVRRERRETIVFHCAHYGHNGMLTKVNWIIQARADHCPQNAEGLC